MTETTDSGDTRHDPAFWVTGPDGALRPRLALDVDADGDGTVLVTADGEIDMFTAPVFRRVLFDALGRNTAPIVAVDLSAVTFLDSTGLSALISVQRVAVTQDRSVKLCNPQPVVRRVLRITGVEATFGLDPE